MARKRNAAPGDTPPPERKIRFTYNEPPEESGESIRYGSWEDGKQPDGDQWYEVDHATGSDYSGGLVTRANYEGLQELLEEKHPSAGKSPAVWATTYGGYGTYGIIVVWDRLDEEIQEAISGLYDYPLLDEEAYSELQMEAENEAWENWGEDEFKSEVEKKLSLEEFPDDVNAYEVFREAAEDANEYWEEQSGGDMYIDMKRVAAKVDVGMMEAAREKNPSPEEKERRRRRKARGEKAKTKRRKKRGSRRRNPETTSVMDLVRRLKF